MGGGILGLAVARELTRRHPRLFVCVLEREHELAVHQSGHNSGVIHSGLYYPPGSLKASLCVRGARELYEYCERRAIPHQASGKVIVATRHAELAPLQELLRRGKTNGVPGLRWLDPSAIQTLEPHARGLAGLHSPRTGIVDFRAVAHAYAQDARERGVSIATACEVLSAKAGARSVSLEHRHGTTEASNALFCAGAWSDRLARAAGAGADPRIVPFRGAYMRLLPQHAHLVRGLIYPVPDPTLPFLGVHLTRSISGEVLIGPTALLARARDGRLLDDFVFSATDRILHVRNAPSPGATSSLAIACHISERAQQAFQLS